MLTSLIGVGVLEMVTAIAVFPRYQHQSFFRSGSLQTTKHPIIFLDARYLFRIARYHNGLAIWS